MYAARSKVVMREVLLERSTVLVKKGSGMRCGSSSVAREFGVVMAV